MEYFELESSHTDPRRMRKEREKAKKLKGTHWWQNQLSAGICHYCEKKFSRQKLTMDHLVPLARGGRSTKGNIVLSCRNCNENKRLRTPVEMIL